MGKVWKHRGIIIRPSLLLFETKRHKGIAELLEVFRSVISGLLSEGSEATELSANGGSFSMNLNDSVTHCIAAEKKGICHSCL